MNREQFLARAKSPQTTEITVGDEAEGHKVRARKLTQAEVETIRKRYATDEKALEGFRYIVSRCVVDEDGKRLFTDDDAARLADIDFETIESIAMRVMQFSGMRVDAKNA